MDRFDKGVAVGMLFGTGSYDDYPDKCTYDTENHTITEEWYATETKPARTAVYTLTIEETAVGQETLEEVTAITLPNERVIELEGFFPDNFT